MSQKASFPDKTKIPRKTFALLFSEIVQYCHQKSDTLEKFSQQLKQMGYPIGCTILEVMQQGSANFKRQTAVVQMLLAVKEKIWPYLFGYQASGLEQQLDNANCYMIYDDKPMVTYFVSYPADLKNVFSCCAFVAGILEGILTTSGFPCEITTHPNNAGGDAAGADKVVFVIEFKNLDSSA
jgi:hypothetical protein